MIRSGCDFCQIYTHTLHVQLLLDSGGMDTDLKSVAEALELFRKRPIYQQTRLLEPLPPSAVVISRSDKEKIPKHMKNAAEPFEPRYLNGQCLNLAPCVAASATKKCAIAAKNDGVGALERVDSSATLHRIFIPLTGDGLQINME